MQKLTAIILSSRDVGEFDRLYTLYTREDGMVRAIGRGVRKQNAKLAGHLEPGTLSEVFVARSRGMGQITSAITLADFYDLKRDFDSLSEVLKIFRFFVKNFAEGETDEKIFDLLEKFLAIFAKFSSCKGKIAVEAFWWKLFDSLGHCPETTKCADCEAKLEKDSRNFFSAVRGRLICEKCLKENGLLEITANQIKLLRVFLANSIEKVSKVKVSENELRGLERIRTEFEKYNF